VKSAGPAFGGRNVELDGTLQRADGDEIAIVDVPNVDLTERNEGLSSSRARDELHLESVGLVHLDDRPQVPAAKTQLGNVPFENDGVE
jgi:hypothetical protein